MTQTQKLYGDVYLEEHKDYALLGTDMWEKLNKIYELAVVGENLCINHKCNDVTMFFRHIQDLAKGKDESDIID